TNHRDTESTERRNTERKRDRRSRVAISRYWSASLFNFFVCLDSVSSAPLWFVQKAISVAADSREVAGPPAVRAPVGHRPAPGPVEHTRAGAEPHRPAAGRHTRPSTGGNSGGDGKAARPARRCPRRFAPQ